MKISPRLLVVLACAWCGLPLLYLLTRPETRVLELAPVYVTRGLLLLIGWGLWRRHSWPKGIAVALALLLTLVAAAMFRLDAQQYDLLAAAVSQRSWALYRDNASNLGGDNPLGLALVLTAWCWFIAIVSFRVKRAAPFSEDVSRSFSERDAGENRVIRIVVAALLAWILVLPPVLNLVRPLRELSPGVWTSDAAHLRFKLTGSERGRLLPRDLPVIDALDADLARIVAGGEPEGARISQTPIVTGDVTYFRDGLESYMLTVSRPHGKITEIAVHFDRRSLRDVVGDRTIQLR